MFKYGDFSAPYFATFVLKTERYGVRDADASAGKYGPEKTPLFSPNAGKYRPEKTTICTTFMQCGLLRFKVFFY